MPMEVLVVAKVEVLTKLGLLLIDGDERDSAVEFTCSEVRVGALP